MIRREPKAILVAHVMDSARRELYVEGMRDRLFLGWLVRDEKDPDTTIIQIASVNIQIDGGGERGRLFAFARWLDDQQLDAINIRCFADADFDRLLNRERPHSIWLTDPRDLEGYTLCVECLDKMLKLGVNTEAMSAEEILEIVTSICSRLGLLRLLSERDALDLPFQRTDLRRRLRFISGQLRVDFDAYLRALLQNADISLARIPSVLRALDDLDEELRDVPHSEIIHGKDALLVIDKLLSRFGVKPNESSRMLWTSFEASFVISGSNLDVMKRFLEG